MRNKSCPQAFALGLESPIEPTSVTPCHGHSPPPCWKEEGVMFLFHAFSSISLFLLLIHLFSFLLTKLFTFLHHKATSKDKGHAQLNNAQNESKPASVAEELFEKDDPVWGEGLLSLFSESAFDDTLLTEQGKDSKEQHSSGVDDTFVPESACGCLDDLADEKIGIKNNDVVRRPNVLTPTDHPSAVPSPTDHDVACKDSSHENKTRTGRENKICHDHEEKKDSSEGEKLSLTDHSHLDSEKYTLEEVHGEREKFGGSLTGDSTSKSSIEWRSSSIFRDSETECQFSSSSRRSSSNWESYTLFRKYDEEMMFFDRISAQKLTETESLRSIKIQPRSISQRIVHKLMTKHKNSSARGRDPYVDLENAYVAQICLTWEALNWNYNFFRQAKTNRDMEAYRCPARVAQQFQQFHVLLQRFIENEPYEYGRRPEVYARMRISSPKLLQVPEFRGSEAEEGKEELISSIEFLRIVEGAIRTFLNFLKADKESRYRVFKALIKRKPSSVDPNLLHLLKKANKKKKMRLKDLGRRRKCLKRRKVKEDDEVEIMMGLIDMQVVSTVLRMPEISAEQLHWCDEKMSKVRVWDGKVHRDSSPLFFPVH